MKSSIVIIGNPAARNASQNKIALASRLLQERGFTTEMLLTEKRGDAERLARASKDSRPHSIMAAGGDGTINEVINGVAGSDVPVSILPLGTTNVLAKELGIPEDIYGASVRAVTALPRKVSLGRIEAMHDGKSVERYFCLMAGIGFDGKAVHDMVKPFKKVSGKAAYILSGLKNLLTYAPEELSITIDGKQYSGYVAVIGKASRYGGNFRIVPDASLSDPFLYSCVFQGKTRRDLLRYVLGVMRGSHLRYRDVLYLRSSNIDIEGTAHIQIDGDYLGLTPARISTVRDALSIIW